MVRHLMTTRAGTALRASAKERGLCGDPGRSTAVPAMAAERYGGVCSGARAGLSRAASGKIQKLTANTTRPATYQRRSSVSP